MAARVIQIVCNTGGDFTVLDGESFCDRLCWDEMLGQVVSLTHPKLVDTAYRQYRMEDVDAFQDRAARHEARMREHRRVAVREDFGL